MQEGWYLSRDGEQSGPYTWEQLVALSEQGQLMAEDYLWHPIDQQWHSLENFTELNKNIQEQYSVSPMKEYWNKMSISHRELIDKYCMRDNT